MATQLAKARHTWTLFPVEVAVAAGPGEHNSAWASSDMAARKGGDGNTGKSLRLSSGLDGVAPPGAKTEEEVEEEPRRLRRRRKWEHRGRARAVLPVRRAGGCGVHAGRGRR